MIKTTLLVFIHLFITIDIGYVYASSSEIVGRGKSKSNGKGLNASNNDNINPSCFPSQQPSTSPSLSLFPSPALEPTLEPTLAPTSTPTLFPWTKKEKKMNKRRKTSSSSLLKINPEKLIYIICKYAGIILPKTIERELKIFTKTCQCDETSLDLINRELEILNFTIALKHPSLSSANNDNSNTKNVIPDPAMRVRRICIRWDSYIQPCLEIEVDDVDILIEFINILLTKNNWNELQEIGFPPTFYSTKTQANDKETPVSSYITFCSIDFSGKATLKVRSRILNKQLINDVEFNLDNLDDLNKKIVDAAMYNTNQKSRNYSGCTTDELYTIIQEYFNELLKGVLKSTATDLAFGFMSDKNKNNTKEKKIDPSLGNDEYTSVVNQATRKLWLGVKDTIVSYVTNVGDKANEEINQNLAEHLGKDYRDKIKVVEEYASMFNSRKKF